jgi:hypothetical protein
MTQKEELMDGSTAVTGAILDIPEDSQFLVKTCSAHPPVMEKRILRFKTFRMF